MQTRGRFSGGEQTRERALGGLRVAADATHHVVARGTDFHWTLGNVYVREFEELMVHAGQFTLHVFARFVRDVQVSATMLGTATFAHFRVNRTGDHIARGEFHPLLVVTLHKALAEFVAEDAPFATNRFRDKDSLHP